MRRWLLQFFIISVVCFSVFKLMVYLSEKDKPKKERIQDPLEEMIRPS